MFSQVPGLQELFIYKKSYQLVSRALGSKLSISVVEEISRKTRDARQELRKYMREVRKHSPEKKCKLGYDKLEVDNKIFVYSEVEGRVVEQRNRKAKDEDNQELLETIDDLKKIISEQSETLGQQSVMLDSYRNEEDDDDD